MKKLLLSIVTLLFIVSVATAEDKKQALVETEVETIRNMLPIEDENIKLFEVEYKPKKGLVYHYVLKNVEIKDHETVISNFKNIRDEILTQLCESLPEDFKQELVKTKSPIIYKYFDGANKLITDISFDLSKCPNK